jgi:Na+/proline symporter
MVRASACRVAACAAVHGSRGEVEPKRGVRLAVERALLGKHPCAKKKKDDLRVWVSLISRRVPSRTADTDREKHRAERSLALSCLIPKRNPGTDMCACSGLYARLSSSKELRWRLILLGAFAVGGLLVRSSNSSSSSGCSGSIGEWHQLYWYSALLILTAQMSDTVREYFLGEGPSLSDHLRYFLFGHTVKSTQEAGASMESASDVGFWTLMPSAFITWIFAKSINNSAVWGGMFGVMGGVAYAGWYTSFFSAALVGYILRTRFGFSSLPIAVERCYGPVGLVCLNLALLFRLWNEIWSNVAVVASFYSATSRTGEWWVAAIISAMVPAIYVMMGGMRASLFSDVVQASLGLFLLFYLLGVVSHQMRDMDVWSWAPAGGYLEGGSTALGAALLQGFGSYPFHDPVLTDRTFLATPRVMLHSFFVGGAISIMFIVLFSSIGILGDYLADPPLGVVSSGSPANVARSLCGVTYGLMNMIMMTSSLSTLDSTYTSCSKLISLELGGWFRLPGDTRKRLGPMTPTGEHVTTRHIAIGRVSIAVLAIVGTVYLAAEDDVLKATTVSGTMVMGLGPPIYLMLLWRYNSQGKQNGFRRSPLAFVLSFVPGVVFGFLYQVSGYKDSDGNPRHPALKAALTDGLSVGSGPYSMFFGLNLLGHGVCLVGCLVGFAIHQFLWKLPRCEAEETVEDAATGERLPRPGSSPVVGVVGVHETSTHVEVTTASA